MWRKKCKLFFDRCKKNANEFFVNFDEGKWANCVEHVKKIEEENLEVVDDIPVHMLVLIKIW